MKTSQRLTPRQFAGLLRLGDIVIPGDAHLPSFSEAGCAPAVDRMLDYMTESDRRGVTGILGLFGILPGALVRAIFWLTEQHPRLPAAIAGPFRLANIGIKGVVMTLYYSDVGDGPSIYERIGWDATVVERGADGGSAPPAAVERRPGPVV